MSKEALTFVAILIPAVAAVIVGVRQSNSSGQSAVAAQLTAIGERLDEANDRLDKANVQIDAQGARITTLERRDRLHVDYTYTLRRTLQRNEIEVPEPPPGLEVV